jgi:hypothetical protein
MGEQVLRNAGYSLPIVGPALFVRGLPARAPPSSRRSRRARVAVHASAPGAAAGSATAAAPASGAAPVPASATTPASASAAALARRNVPVSSAPRGLTAPEPPSRPVTTASFHAAGMLPAIRGRPALATS